MKKYRSLIVKFIVPLLLTGCAPEVKRLTPHATKPLLGPKQTDVTLRFNGAPNLYEKIPNLNGAILPTNELLNLVENLLQLSTQLNLPAMNNLATQILGALYSNSENIQSVSFEQSPYANAAIQETKPLVQKELNLILKQLSVQQNLIISLLDQRTKPAPQNARYPFTEFSNIVSTRLMDEVDFLESHGVDPIVITTIRQILASMVFPRLQKADPYIQSLVKAESLAKALQMLERIFSVFEYTPNKELLDKIQFGYQIAHSIDGIHSEQSALTLIIQFWKMMTPPQRLENFKPASPDLYDYLAGRNERELNCLASDSCLDLMIMVAKKKIFSGLRNYGLTKLQETFNRGARQFVVDLIEQRIPEEIANTPQEMKKQIVTGLDNKRTELIDIQSNFEGFLRNLLLGWAKQNIYTARNQSLPLLEKGQLRLNLINGKPEVSPFENLKSTYQPQIVGSSFALTALRWSRLENPLNNGNLLLTENDPTLARNMLDQINKLLLVYDHRPELQTQKEKTQFSAFAMAELIRGLSKISYHFRDFEPTLFDSVLGQANVGDLDMEGIPTDIAKQSLFPKDIFFALAIGNIGLQLKALSHSPSPIFVVDTENRVQWLDQLTAPANSPNVMAGVVDIVNGKRSKLVKSQSLAHFLRALIEFYRATENLERTKASRLLEKNSEGKTNLETLQQSRTDIRDLIIGLSNFLSHQIKSPEGATLHSIRIDETVVKTQGTLYLEDQIATIEGLLDSYELLQTKIYLWAALDTYYTLNRTLWNPSIDFYRGANDGTSATFAERIATLRMLARLREFLPLASQQQAERILQINMKAYRKSGR